MIILGIETSCDETAASVFEIKNGEPRILSNVVSSQIDIHKKYGGVVPEVAARKHAEVIFDVIKKAFSDANAVNCMRMPRRNEKNANNFSEIDLIAVTKGPGLITSLHVGVLAAQALAAFAEKPLVGVNHIEAHLLSPFLSYKNMELPAIGLIASGGHTELILMNAFGKYRIIGSTRDDAVGEAFDKVAKMLGLGYPGGPAISQLVAEWKSEKNSKFSARGGQNSEFSLPRPMMNSNDFDFSFAGLKTAVLYLIKEMSPRELKRMTPAIAAEFQRAAIDVLVAKTKKAAKKYSVKSILVGGGVIANEELREALKKLDTPVYLPEMRFAGDNAVMIAFAGWKKWQRTKRSEVLRIKAEPNSRL